MIESGISKSLTRPTCLNRRLKTPDRSECMPPRVSGPDSYTPAKIQDIDITVVGAPLIFVNHSLLNKTFIFSTEHRKTFVAKDCRC